MAKEADLNGAVARALIAHAIKEARAGHLAPLIGRVRSGVALTPEEREFVAAALERREGKRGKDELRRVEKQLIRWRVEELRGQVPKLEAAVEQVMKERDRSRAFVFDALKESKKPK